MEMPNLPTLNGSRWLADFGRNDAGFIYVFDAVPWRPGQPLVHGQVVDLADAPAFFYSQRMKVQRGCLMYADAEIRDLKPQYLEEARCPISMRWPMDDAPGLDRSIEQMFPGPDEDDWYARFLSIPLVPRRRMQRSPASFEPPISLSVYVPSDQTLIDRTLRRTNIPIPFTVFPHVVQQADPSLFAAAAPGWSLESLRQPVPILLEGPVMASTVPWDMWNSQLLHGDQAMASDVYDIERFEKLGKVELGNVFVEFSPLESLGWEDEEPVELTRALWLVRQQHKYLVTLFGQVCTQHLGGPDGDPDIISVGPVLVEYAADDSEFGYRSPQGVLPLESLGRPFVKAFYSVLELLRSLSPALKPSPYPAMILHKTSGGTAFIGIGTRAVCRLEKPDTPELRYHFVPRIAGTENVYAGGFSKMHHAYAGMCMFPIDAQPAATFREVEAKVIRAALRKSGDRLITDPRLGPVGIKGALRQFFGPGLARQRRARERRPG